MKQQAVRVLSSAFDHRNAKMNHPNDQAFVLSKFRHFRTHLLNFKSIAREVRSWDKDSDSEIGNIQKLMEELMEKVELFKD